MTYFQCRENFDCFQREGEDLKWKMLMVISVKEIDFVYISFLQRPEDHLLRNQEYNREGYLFLIERSIYL